MHKLITLASIAMFTVFTGCQMALLKDKTVRQDGTSHVVTAIEASLISNQKLQDLDIDYNGVKIKLASWSTKGDAQFIKALGEEIAKCILAYGTAGGSVAIQEAVKAAKGKTAVDALKDCVDGSCAPATPCAPGDICSPVK
jgi:hypothetical protein